MKFNVEELTEEDKVLFNSFKIEDPFSGRRLAKDPLSWVVDRENKYYLGCLGGRGHLGGEYPPNHYILIINNSIIRTTARYKCVGNYKTGVSITWDIGAVYIPKELKNIKQDLLKEIIEASFEVMAIKMFSGHLSENKFVSTGVISVEGENYH